MDYPISFADQLAQHLKAFRKSRGLAQAQLAVHVGVTQSRVADIEANPGKVSLENLLKVFAALNVRVLLRDADAKDQSLFGAKEPRTLVELKAVQGRATSDGTDW